MVSPDTRAFCFQQMRKPSPERIRTSLKYLPFTKQKHVCEVGISVLPFFFCHFFSRSLSVPYAYQCCAFWGCDSYAHSNTEDNSLQDHSGSKDKGKCMNF